MVLALVGLVALVGLALPRSWHVERSVVIAASPEQIAPYLIDLRRWQDWSSRTKAADPLVRNTYEGPDDGVGGKWLWLGPVAGRGFMQVQSVTPGRVVLSLALDGMEVNVLDDFTLTPEGDGTRVSWVDRGALPVFGGLFLGTVESRLGASLELGLARLKALVEQRVS